MKVSDKDFWRILRECGGIYNKAAKRIRASYPVSDAYDRSDVAKRAAQNPEKLAQIREGNCDDAEDVMYGLFRSKNEKIRLEAAKFILKTQGKNRGYTERIEQTGADGKDLNQSLQVEIIDRRDQVDNDEDTND